MDSIWTARLRRQCWGRAGFVKENQVDPLATRLSLPKSEASSPEGEKIGGNWPPVCGCIAGVDQYTEWSSSELCH